MRGSILVGGGGGGGGGDSAFELSISSTIPNNNN